MNQRLLGGLTAIAIGAIASPAWSQAGLMTGGAEDLPPITLSSGKPLADAPYEIEAGKFYEIKIIADGSAEIALEGPEFFRNTWINEIVINDIEIRPTGVSSFEFDDEGELEMDFIFIRPGIFELRIPGTTSDSQKAVFIVK